MRTQLDLFPRPTVRVRTPAEVEEPRLWVQRLVVWSEPGRVVREVSLRPGLNIVWSPDPGDVGEGLELPDAVGHGSGKTLLCRLLRYCLGEERFAPDGQREDIRAAFPEGMVGADVRLDGETWSVVRPIGHRRRHLAARDADLDELAWADGPALGVEPLVDAIGRAFVTGDIGRALPTDLGGDAWLASLALLSRDQECRFNHVLDWRSPRSDSESPVRVLSQAEVLDTLLALIGATEPVATPSRSATATLVRQREKAKADALHWAWDVGRRRAALIARLGLAEVDLLPGALELEAMRATAKAKLSEAVGDAVSEAPANLGRSRAQRDAVRARVETLSARQATLIERIELTTQERAKVRGELPGASATLSRAGVQECPVCAVPIDLALAQGCKLSREPPNPDAARSRFDRLREEERETTKRLNDAASEKSVVDAELVRERAHLHDLEEAVVRLEAAQEARHAAWEHARRLAHEVEQLEEAMRDHERAQHVIADLDGNIARLRETMVSPSGAAAERFGSLASHFAAIVRDLVGDGADGRAALTGKGLSLQVLMGGNRATAAIDSLKVLAFDLAVLLLSIEGRTNLPAFLVHDSPREADLGLQPYHRLFELVRHIEEQLGERPLFQYIVTTTTRPPAYLRCDPWLRLTLRGGPPEQRLLRRDL